MSTIDQTIAQNCLTHPWYVWLLTLLLPSEWCFWIIRASSRRRRLLGRSPMSNQWCFTSMPVIWLLIHVKCWYMSDTFDNAFKYLIFPAWRDLLQERRCYPSGACYLAHTCRFWRLDPLQCSQKIPHHTWEPTVRKSLLKIWIQSYMKSEVTWIVI